MDKPKRLLSLDVFRGLTIALMVVVNNPGNWEYVYAPLRHSSWHGCTPTDLVFPFFMFIMGSAMWYSFKKFGHSLSKELTLRILRRAIGIFLIGLAINVYISKGDLTHLRIMGVLNRIALGYGIAAFIVLSFRYNYVRVITGIILLGYWVILFLFGGDTAYSLEGNFVGTFDKFVLGANHLPGYHGAVFDQTGLLATLPSIGNVLFGYITGRLIDTTEEKLTAVKRLIIYGVSGIIIAKIWDLAFPINKPLWTSSFVVYTSGFAMVFLGILLWIIDIKGYKKWTTPLQVFGMNPLFLYVFSSFLAISLRYINFHSESGEIVPFKEWLFVHIFQPFLGNMNGSLVYALLFGTICWFLGWIMFRKRIFIKI